MSYLRRVRSFDKFCVQLQNAAQQTVKPYLAESSYYSPKSKSKRYLDDTFNSMLRKQPLIIKQEHMQACKSSFCEEMQKLLEKGIWIQNKYKKRIRNINNEEDISFRRCQTPTFSNFQISNQRRISNLKRSIKQNPNDTFIKSKYNSSENSVMKSTNNSRTTQQYQQKIKQLQANNRLAQSRLQNKLREVQNQNRSLKRNLYNSRNLLSEADVTQKIIRKSGIRQKKIRELLKQIGVPLIQKQLACIKTGFQSTGYERKIDNQY